MHLRILIYVLKKRLPTRRKTLFDSFYAFRGVEKPILRFEVLPEMSGTSFHVLKSFPTRRKPFCLAQQRGKPRIGDEQKKGEHLQ